MDEKDIVGMSEVEPRVLHVITRLDPGGSSYICRVMYERMKEKGFRVFLAAGPSVAGYPDFIHLRFLRRDINILYDILAVAELFFLLKRIKPDILHLHTSKAGFAGRIAGKAAGIRRIIYQPHGPVFYGYFGKLKSLLILLTERVMARMADTMVFLARSSMEDFAMHNIGRNRQYAVIENGVDTGLFSPPDNDEKRRYKTVLGFKADDIVAGMVGRIVDIKGHRYFLEAFDRLSAKYKNIKGLIAGDGDMEDRIRQEAKERGLSGLIRFTGYRKDIENVIKAVDILVQPSIVEGFGLSIIEAGACAIPAVGFRVGGIRDLIIDGVTGYTVKLKDAGALASGLEMLITDISKRDEMGKKAREYVLSNFTLDRMIEKLESLYLEGAKTGRRYEKE